MVVSPAVVDCGTHASLGTGTACVSAIPACMGATSIFVGPGGTLVTGSPVSSAAVTAVIVASAVGGNSGR